MERTSEEVRSRRPHWVLPQDEWEAWSQHYLEGHDLECRVCGRSGSVSLSPSQHTAAFPCGHVMELPAYT